MKLKYFAFTLAETLITLGIIGVVAALTIPNLIHNYQAKSTATRLKKAYAIVLQAYKLAKEDYGDISTWYNLSSEDERFLYYKYDFNEQGMKILSQYMKTANLCIQSNRFCQMPGYHNKYLNGNTDFFVNMHPSMILLDGTEIYFTNYSNDCTETKNKVCGYLYIDINGRSKPNTRGIDNFEFYIMTNSIVPTGLPGDITAPFNLKDQAYGKDNACDRKSRGGGCTAWVLKNENMDYLKCADK